MQTVLSELTPLSSQITITKSGNCLAIYIFLLKTPHSSEQKGVVITRNSRSIREKNVKKRGTSNTDVAK